MMVSKFKKNIGQFPENVIKEETMLFSSSKKFSEKFGGPITRACCELIPEPECNNLVIDTRVHMLKPGWCPAIAGWHCDAVPRGDKGQPDLFHPARGSIEHYLMIVDFGTGSLTEFLYGEPDDLRVVEGKGVWESFSEQINNNGEPRFSVESGQMYKFDSFDFHNTTEAKGSGWRFFFRASYNTFTKGPFNEIRNQVQVYLPNKNSGW